MDPLAEKSIMISVYHYGANSPVNFLDQDGNYAIRWHYKFTSNAMYSLGYNSQASDLAGHYASTYADNPIGHLGIKRQEGC